MLETIIPPCNHTSVGIVVQDELGRLLVIERQKFPYGYACPAGHLEEGETVEQGAVRELSEETGLTVVSLSPLFGATAYNRCRRPGGEYHIWYVYAAQVSGDLVVNPNEVKQMGWYDRTDLFSLKLRTQAYLAGDVSEQDWQTSPGLELVWYDFLTYLGWL